MIRHKGVMTRGLVIVVSGGKVEKPDMISVWKISNPACCIYDFTIIIAVLYSFGWKTVLNGALRTFCDFL